MQTLVVTALIFGLSMAAMAVGVIFSGRRLQGSCGGTGQNCRCGDEAARECARAAEHSDD